MLRKFMYCDRASAVYRCEKLNLGAATSFTWKSACSKTYMAKTIRFIVSCLSPMARAILASTTPDLCQSAANLAFAYAFHFAGPLMCLKPMKVRAAARLSTWYTDTWVRVAATDVASGTGISTCSWRRIDSASAGSESRRSVASRLLPSRTTRVPSLAPVTTNGSMSRYPLVEMDSRSSSSSAVRYSRAMMASSECPPPWPTRRGFAMSSMSLVIGTLLTRLEVLDSIWSFGSLGGWVAGREKWSHIRLSMASWLNRIAGNTA